MTVHFLGEIRNDVDTIETTLTTTRNTLAEVLTKMSSLESQGTGTSYCKSDS